MNAFVHPLSLFFLLFSLQKFPKDDVCPKDHVKISGVSICLKARDLCKKCPKYVEMDAANCLNGKVVQSEDCNGCMVSK